MRISDWSSDVCSSDLQFGRQIERQAQGVAALIPAMESLAGARQHGACHVANQFRAFGDEDEFTGQRHAAVRLAPRSEEDTSELQSLMRISYAVFCLQ